MKKINYYLAVFLMLVIPQVGYSQDLNLTSAGNTILKALEGLYVIVGGIGFLYVAYQQLDNFRSEGNRLDGFKALGWYLLVFVGIAQIYKFIMASSL